MKDTRMLKYILILLNLFPLMALAKTTYHEATEYFAAGATKTLFTGESGEGPWVVYSGEVYKKTQGEGRSCEFGADSYDYAIVQAYDKHGNICHDWDVCAFALEFEPIQQTIIDGKTIPVKITAKPGSGSLNSKVDQYISDLKIEFKDKDGGTNYENKPGRAANSMCEVMKIEKKKPANDKFNWEVNNAQWYWYSAQSGDQKDAKYQLTGNFKYNGKQIELEKGEFTVGVGNTFENSYASAEFRFDNDPTFTIVGPPNRVECTGVGQMRRVAYNLKNMWRFMICLSFIK